MLLLEYAHRVSGPRASYAAAFSPPLLNPDQATPPTVGGPSGKAAVKRYNVYRNNVTVSLRGGDDLCGASIAGMIEAGVFTDLNLGEG